MSMIEKMRDILMEAGYPRSTVETVLADRRQLLAFKDMSKTLRRDL